VRVAIEDVIPPSLPLVNTTQYLPAEEVRLLAKVNEEENASDVPPEAVIEFTLADSKYHCADNSATSVSELPLNVAENTGIIESHSMHDAFDKLLVMLYSIFVSLLSYPTLTDDRLTHG
jgi:hypothetical protein